MGKIRFLSIGLFLFFKIAFSQNLSDYKWNHRLLILVAEKENSKVVVQKVTFSNFKEDFKERDLLLLERLPGNKELIERFHISEKFEGVLLIGKDGGLKLKKPFFLKAENILKLIDGMPMQKAEMKKY